MNWWQLDEQDSWLAFTKTMANNIPACCLQKHAVAQNPILRDCGGIIRAVADNMLEVNEVNGYVMLAGIVLLGTCQESLRTRANCENRTGDHA